MHGKKKYTIYIPIFLEPIEPQREILDPVAEIITNKAKDEMELISIMRDVDVVLLTSRHKVTRSLMQTCPNLRLIAKYGVGVENIDVDSATEMGIPVTNVPGINCNAVAELTIGLILAVLRQIQKTKEHMRSGGWKDEGFVGHELLGSSIGIIGYGDIARLVIRKLQGFEVRRILVFTESRSCENAEFSNVGFVDLYTLLRESNIVTIHKALTPHSKGLIGEKELQSMQDSAYLINTSRGPLVDETVLIKSLKERWIAGAALDVFEYEPLSKDSPLLSLDNVVLTPHIGGVTFDARLEMVTTVATNIVNILQGKEVDTKFLVNPEVLHVENNS